MDRHLLRATESDESLARYRALIGEVRRIVVVLAVAVVVCAVLGGAGVAAVVLLFGAPVAVAVGAGAAAGGAMAVKAGHVARRWLRGRT